MSAQPLLIELSTEELPPKALNRLGKAFGQAARKALAKHHLVPADGQITVFAAPRHLGVRVEQVLAQGETREVKLKGPSAKVGHDENGQPTLALTKWAEKQGVEISSLSLEKSGKQENFVVTKQVIGEQLANVINPVIESALNALPIPKLMQYQLADGKTTVSFVRPAHHLIVLHGDSVVPASVLGLQSNRVTYGHRFNGATVSADKADQPIQVSIKTATQYEEQMRAAKVITKFDERRASIAEQLNKQAGAANANLGDQADVDTLLDEVTALVEWPAVYAGQFDKNFLQVPPECLILTMRTNQKYFPLFDANGALSNRFLICSNLDVKDPALIVDGNERVVRPRLADAEFFYDQDRKTRLDARIERLKSVVYHAKLGTQAQRAERVSQLAGAYAKAMGYSEAQIGHCERAAMLAKTDLITDMVGEFPELQGIMGTYYARHDGEHEDVALALTEQYQPRFAGDKLPAQPVGTALALADKMETLAGLFSINQRPSGDKDPFALRRHALGVLRMLVEKRLGLSVAQMISLAGKPFSASPDSMQALTDFIYERLVGYLKDSGNATAQIAAVVEYRPDNLGDINERLAAVAEFSRMPESAALAAANKRIGNILRKADGDFATQPNPQLYEDGAERDLADAIATVSSQVDAAVGQSQYTKAMALMAQTSAPVDRFFEDVMVMAEDQAVRHNRLLMLSELHKMMNRVADISRLVAS